MRRGIAAATPTPWRMHLKLAENDDPQKMVTPPAVTPSASFSLAWRGSERRAPSFLERWAPTRLSHNVPVMFQTMVQGSLLPHPQPLVPDAEVVETLRTAIAGAGRLPRSAELLLCGLCAEYLLAELHNAGLSVVRIEAWDVGGSGAP